MGLLRNDENTGPGDIAGWLDDGLEAADLLFPITYNVVTPGTFVPGVGGAVAATTKGYAVRGYVDTDMERYRERGILQLGSRVVAITRKSADRAGLPITEGTTEHLNDQVVARGITSTVREVNSDPAQAMIYLGVEP